jgi:hypothetical protein
VIVETDDTGIHLWRYEDGDRWIEFTNRTEHLLDAR